MRSLVLMMSFWTLVGCSTQPSQPAEPAQSAEPSETLTERSQRLAQELLIVDGHIDLPYRLEAGRDESGTITEDVTVRTDKGDFDFIRSREGGCSAPPRSG